MGNRLLMALILALGVAGASLAQDTQAPEELPVVTLFSIDFCPSCLAAKRHFEQEGIPYQEFNIQHSSAARETFERLGGRGIPFLVVNGKTMNGFHPQRFAHLWAQVMEAE